MINRQRGFNLIELMVSLLLSSLVITILMHGVLLIQRQTDEMARTMHRAGEEAWIVALLQTCFHQAGFTPCRRLDELKRIDRREAPESLDSVAWVKPDKLVLQHMSSEFALVREVVDSQTLLIDPLKLNPAYPILVSDCQHAEVHSIEAIRLTNTGAYVHLRMPLHYVYDSPFYVGEWISESFFTQQHALFYASHHVDELSSLIHQISGHLYDEKGHKVLALTLGGVPKIITIHGRNV